MAEPTARIASGKALMTSEAPIGASDVVSPAAATGPAAPTTPAAARRAARPCR
jgi:hypothetical protein